jgi:DNA-binding NarL/FixJ family response regulator
MLDISMPIMNGFDTLIEIRKRWPQMKVLIFTTFDTERYIIKMIRNGANGYLLKDCDPEEIKAALVSIDQKGVYHSDLVPSRFTNAIKQNLIQLPNLTEKEMVVAKYACTDLTYAEIAVKMKTTTRSVEGYRDSHFKKLRVNSRVSLALYAVQSGLVPLEIALDI